MGVSLPSPSFLSRLEIIMAVAKEEGRDRSAYSIRFTTMTVLRTYVRWRHYDLLLSLPVQRQQLHKCTVQYCVRTVRTMWEEEGWDRFAYTSAPYSVTHAQHIR